MYEILRILIQISKLFKKFDIYETTGNLNTDLVWDDIKKSLQISFRGGNSIWVCLFRNSQCILISDTY